MPTYDFNKFKKCCQENKDCVMPFKKAQDDASLYFGLKTKNALLEFIANDGLEDLSFINTKPWENNSDKNSLILVDAYEFRSMCKLGYIAFMYNEITIKWLLKSFHLSKNSDFAIAIAMRKAGIRRE